MIGGRDDPFTGDTVVYFGIADDLWEGSGFDRLEQFYTPGYPVLIAAVRPLPGSTEVTLSVLQHLVGAVVVAVIVLAAWRWFGRVAAWSAGLLAAFTPVLLISEHFLLPDFMFGVLVLAGALLLAEACTRAPPSLALLALSGVSFGLATWIKPAGQFLLVAAPIALLFATRGVRPALRGSAVALIAMVLTVSPWLYRNIAEFGSPVMSNQGNITLFNRAFEVDRLPFPEDSEYAGLARRVRREDRRTGIRFHESFRVALTEEGLSSREAMAEQGSLALTAIWRHPADYAAGTAEGAVRAVWDQSQPHHLGEIRPGNDLPQKFSNGIWRLSTVLVWVWLVASLAGAAAFLLPFRGDERSRKAAVALLTVWLTVMLGTVLGNGQNWRYSLQVAPLYWMLGSAGAVALWGAVLQRARVTARAGSVSP